MDMNYLNFRVDLNLVPPEKNMDEDALWDNLNIKEDYDLVPQEEAMHPLSQPPCRTKT